MSSPQLSGVRVHHCVCVNLSLAGRADHPMASRQLTQPATVATSVAPILPSEDETQPLLISDDIPVEPSVEDPPKAGQTGTPDLQKQGLINVCLTDTLFSATGHTSLTGL